MEITFAKQTALAIIRSLRANMPQRDISSRRANIVAPDPFPRKRWSKGLFHAIDLGLPLELGNLPIEVAVPDGSMRLGTKSISCSTYSNRIPKGSFIDLGNGITISGPELLFAELASSMNPVEHLMLGHELCGTFSRDAYDPYNGPITYGAAPMTSTKRIQEFLNKAKFIRGIDKASESAAYLNDNAWSPTESLVAALLRLPIDSMGYDIGQLELNPRTYTSAKLPGAKSSRVPDIVIAGTPVGLNYDGLVHLNLNSIATAAFEAGLHPELSQPQSTLAKTLRDVRAKAVDDIRRNRELAAEGLFVFPVVKEDLYVPGGLDRIFEQLLDALERLAGRNVSNQRKTLNKKALNRERHRTILSLLPGKSERNIQIGQMICSSRLWEREAPTLTKRPSCGQRGLASGCF